MPAGDYFFVRANSFGFLVRYRSRGVGEQWLFNAHTRVRIGRHTRDNLLSITDRYAHARGDTLADKYPARTNQDGHIDSHINEYTDADVHLDSDGNLDTVSNRDPHTHQDTCANSYVLGAASCEFAWRLSGENDS